MVDGLYRDAGLDEAGVAHGVTSRSLGDMKSHVAREAAAKRAGLDYPVTVRQVHGTSVVYLDLPRVVELARAGLEADALVTRTPKRSMAVFVADCMPVFAFDPKARLLGLAHAGWRGTRDGVVPKLVAALKGQGAEPADLKVAIGPHVGPCCYVVSPETAAQFPAPAVHESPKGPVVDLAETALLQLEAAGVPRDAVSVCGVCTASNPDLLYSFRRDKTDSRMMAFAALQ